MKSVKLAFECFGECCNPPLIVLHGFFASSRNWRQMAKKLADDYYVYVLDLRNHGGSPHSTEMNYPVMAADLMAFMDDQQLKTASFLGHSMGGKVAMWFALNYPEKINYLIIADISPVAYQHSFDETINALKRIPLDEISNRKQADDYLAVDILELSYRQFLLQNLQLTAGKYNWRVDLDIFYHQADNIIAFPSIESITPFDGRVLFLMGGNSSYLNKATIDICFIQAKIVVLENANHWLHVDAPEAFLAATRNFLQNN